MRPDVIIHIGPPKTGTTSLQVALDEVEHPDFFYAGTFQPRSRNAGSSCQMLYRACSDKLGRQIKTSKLQAELEQLTKQRKAVLFSEEMFLLEQQEVSIEEKIFNLRRAFSGFNCRILISARSGKSALPSLYQEIFHSLPMKLQMDFSEFCRDRRASCYDYIAVCEMLERLGFDDIFVFDFEDLTKKKLNLGVLTSCDEFLGYVLSAKHHNAGLSGSGGNERVLPKVSFKSFGGSALGKSLIKVLNLRKWPGYRSLVNILDGFEISPSGSRNLVVPHDISRSLETSYKEALRRFGEDSLKNSVNSN